MIAGACTTSSYARGAPAAKRVRTPAAKLDAEPTHAHRCLVALQKGGLLKHWVQLNPDGSAQKAGYPQRLLNEIQGSWFDPANPVVAITEKQRTDLYQWLENWVWKADLCLCVGASLPGISADRVAENPAKLSSEDPPRALGTVIINQKSTPLDSRSVVRIWASPDDALRILASKLGIEVTAVRERHPLGDIFRIPYNDEGQLDKSRETALSLAKDAVVRIVNPYASSVGMCGKSLGRNRAGDYEIDFGDGKIMRLGKWWVLAAQRGEVPRIPVLNYADPKPAAPRPQAWTFLRGPQFEDGDYTTP